MWKGAPQLFPNNHVILECLYDNLQITSIDFCNDGKDRTCLVSFHGHGANCCPCLTSVNRGSNLASKVHFDARVYVCVVHHHQPDHYTMTLNCFHSEHFGQNSTCSIVYLSFHNRILFGFYLKQQDYAASNVTQLNRK